MNIKWPDEASTAAFFGIQEGSYGLCSLLSFWAIWVRLFSRFPFGRGRHDAMIQNAVGTSDCFSTCICLHPGFLKMRMIMLMINGHYPQHHDSDHENQFISLWFDNDYLLWVLMMMLVMMMLMIKKEITIINVNKSDRETVVLDDIDHHP